MVGGLQFPGMFFLGKEQGEIHHPKEGEQARVTEHHSSGFQKVSAFQAQLSQQRALQTEDTSAELTAGTERSAKDTVWIPKPGYSQRSD